MGRMQTRPLFVVRVGGRGCLVLLVVLSCCQLARADIFPYLHWGLLVEEAEHPGVYRMDVRNQPSNDRFDLPLGFPQIVRCERVSDARSQTLDFECDLTAELPMLVLPGWKTLGKGFTRIYLRGKTPQSADGRITLSGIDAGGKSSKTADRAGHADRVIGKQESLDWTYDATRWGRYTVWLTYAAPDESNAKVQFVMGESRVEGDLNPTKSLSRYRSKALGSIYLSKTDRFSPRLQVDEVGTARIAIHALSLEPACEGKPPVQSGDEPIVLHSRDATVHGTMLRYEPDPKKNTLGYWTRATDAASWQVTVKRAGNYDVEVLQGCGKGEGGSEIEVRVDQNPLTFIVEDTGHFQNFKPRIIGRVLLSAGEHEVRVQPRKIARHAALDLRQVRLIPARTPAVK